MLGKLDSLLSCDLMRSANFCLQALALRNTITLPAKNDDKIHTIDTDLGVIPDTKIDVLADTEAEAGRAEARLGEFV